MEEKQYLLIKVFVLIFTLTLFSACNNEERAKIKISNLEYSKCKVIIEEQRVTGKKIIDSLYFSSKGKLTYKFNLKQPKFYNLRFNNSDEVFLLLHPTDVVSISGNEKELVIDGSDESKKLNYL